MAANRSSAKARMLDGRGLSRARILLLLPFLAALTTPPATEPLAALGVLGAYWYQALWVFLSAGLITAVYRLEKMLSEKPS